ncbi:MAG: PEP-CTERM sorting domain-containing protein [Kiritimatiellae bacterium]|nr:PEP-CTERM sorting domain-containing protein [Kiritimatiellia bacterium]
MQTATQNASNWAAVPEPTSGLLLLLGMAGLALKRKRA